MIIRSPEKKIWTSFKPDVMLGPIRVQTFFYLEAQGKYCKEVNLEYRDTVFVNIELVQKPFYYWIPAKYLPYFMGESPFRKIFEAPCFVQRVDNYGILVVTEKKRDALYSNFGLHIPFFSIIKIEKPLKT